MTKGAITKGKLAERHCVLSLGGGGIEFPKNTQEGYSLRTNQ